MQAEIFEINNCSELTLPEFDILRVTVFTKEVIETSIVPSLLALPQPVFDAEAVGFVPIPEAGVNVIIGEAVLFTMGHCFWVLKDIIRVLLPVENLLYGESILMVQTYLIELHKFTVHWLIMDLVI